MSDNNRGLYRKFKIERTDGSSKSGGKHENCQYFVLDLMHDKFSRIALESYADACADEYPSLATDLRLKLGANNCGCRSVGGCPHIFSGPLMEDLEKR